jgi:vancomycin aglycone glucosyltransferase
MKSAAEVVGRAQNSMSLFPEVMARVIQMWVDKSATLASLAHGADLVLAGINEQAIAANVAECQGIPLAALALLPGATFLVGAAVPEHDEGGRRRAASCAGLAGGSGLRTRPTGDPGYEEFCVPGLAAEWGELAARRPFVGALTVELPTDADGEVLSWIAAGTPPICFGLGSTPIASPADMVAMIGAARAQLGERALVCSGPNDVTGVPAFDHVKVVGAVSHAAVLPGCRAVVHHGGAGTTAAGMRPESRR